jgi:hypothetical protein
MAEALAMRIARRSSSGRSSPGLRKRSCSRHSDSSSNHARPTRNGSVPVPPERPVVSVSRKRTRERSIEERESSRAKAARDFGETVSAPAMGVRPWQWAGSR